MNNYRHLELYFGPPCSGRSIHMCNPRLPAEHYRYIVNDAPIIQGWGMTETSPLGTLSTLRTELADADPETQYEYRATAGMPVRGFRVRIRDEEGAPLARDGETVGELECRAPWVVDEYHDRPEASAESFTDDGWLKTGDIATMDEHGYVDVLDRTKDVIKSGGEWISSVELENERWPTRPSRRPRSSPSTTSGGRSARWPAWSSPRDRTRARTS